MKVSGIYPGGRLARCLTAWVMLLSWSACGFAVEDNADLMIDRLPFDRITLNGENENAVLEVVLLDLPERQAPDPIPTSGSLEIHQLSNPSLLYTLDWSAIAKIELYEEMLLQDAVRLGAAGKSAEAFRTLQFLHNHYPKLRGLQEASEQYVKHEALASFSAKRYDESLAILLSLYDINPEHRGLAEAVQSVSDRVITAYLADHDFAAARGVLELLKQGFPTLKLQNVATWESNFQTGAARELATGRSAFDAGRYNEARVAIRRADDILPGIPEAIELMRQLDSTAPQLIVGVNQLVTTPDTSNDLEWSQSRVSRLTCPPLVEIVDFGTEGGIYRSRHAKLESDDSGLLMNITLKPGALRQGLAPENVALELLRLSDPASDHFQADVAALFENVSISDGDQVFIHWRQPHVRPEALVRLSLPDLFQDPHPPGVYRAVTDDTLAQQRRYELSDNAAEASGPRTIIEQAYENEEAALAALFQGEVSVLEQVPPWQFDQVRSDPRVSVGIYRLPTVHALQLNFSQPLLGSREFRRALCYGIDRQSILRDLILAKAERPGFRVLTGPMPAGQTASDSVGYAYNQQLPTRPYEPRLGALLATVARASLAKKQQGDKPPEVDQETEKPDTPPLTLIYPPEPVARICCQAISLQLTAIGIPIKLKELSSESSALPVDYDLRYVELAIHEPLVDARKLLGPKGFAGQCSASMSLALDRVDQAKNWREVRERLQAVHTVAYYDLPVIPLWQTVDAFAHRKSLGGIGETSVTLYQDVADWRVLYPGGSPK